MFADLFNLVTDPGVLDGRLGSGAGQSGTAIGRVDGIRPRMIRPVERSSARSASPGRDRRHPHVGSNAHNWLLDADITACFDEISTRRFWPTVRRRIRTGVSWPVKAFESGCSARGWHRPRHEGRHSSRRILPPLLGNIALSVRDEHFAHAWHAGMSTESTYAPFWPSPASRVYKLITMLMHRNTAGTVSDVVAVENSPSRGLAEPSCGAGCTDPTGAWHGPYAYGSAVPALVPAADRAGGKVHGSPRSS
jgi:hypothetical protein